MEKKPTPIIFYVILALLPVLFFVSIEFGLRMINYGNDYSLFHKPKDGTSGMLYLNPTRSYKYFGSLKGTVFFRGIGFKEKKESGSFRIFVLGGSSAQGFPYAQNASFPSHLKRRIEWLHPDQPIEVVNLGASAINSHTLLDILPEVLDEQPDLLLIYAGHNEYYGALGSASSKSLGAHPALVRVMLWLKELRSFQFLEQTVAYVFPKQNKSSANLMEDMIGESYVYQGSPIYQAGIKQYEYNMRKMLEMIEEREIPIVMGTLASNLKDHRPFNSEQADQMGLSADQHYEFANQFFEEGKFDEAKSHFLQAKELDGLRFRAPEKINETIRQLAQEFDVPLVRVDTQFDHLSEGHIVGNNLLCDHLHPNMQGYYELSKAYYATIQNHGLLPSPKQEMESSILDSLLLAQMPFTKLDSMKAHLTLVNLLGNYPYVPKGQPNPLLSTIKKGDFVDEMGAVPNVDSARVIIAGKYLELGDTAAFRRELEVFSSYFPSKEKPYLSLMAYLENLGQISQLLPIMIDQLEGERASISKDKMLGLLYTSDQNYKAAIANYSRVVTERRNEVEILSKRGFCYLMIEDYQKAAADYDAVIRLDPDNMEAHHQRGVARFELKDYAGTIEDFSEIIASGETTLPQPYFIRGYAFYGMGNKESACADWQMAAKYGHRDAKKLGVKFCN